MWRKTGSWGSWILRGEAVRLKPGYARSGDRRDQPKLEHSGPMEMKLWLAGLVLVTLPQSTFSCGHKFWPPWVSGIKLAYLQGLDQCSQYWLDFRITWRTLKTTCAQAHSRATKSLLEATVWPVKFSKANHSEDKQALPSRFWFNWSGGIFLKVIHHLWFLKMVEVTLMLT